MEDSCLIEFEPVESLLLALLVEAGTLGAAWVDHRRPVDSILLLSMEMPRGEELEVSGNRRLADVGLLSEVAFEALDWIVGEEDVHVLSAVELLSSQRVLVRSQTGVETHTGDVDSLTSNVEEFRRWTWLLQKVGVS